MVCSSENDYFEVVVKGPEEDRLIRPFSVAQENAF